MGVLSFLASPYLLGTPLHTSNTPPRLKLTAQRKNNSQPTASKATETEEREERGAESIPLSSRQRRGNWVFKILRAGSISALQGIVSQEEKADEAFAQGESCTCCCSSEFFNEEERVKVDRDLFMRMLRRVSLKETNLYRRLAYLGKLAYNIPRIKSEDLLKSHRLRFVTSSFESKPENGNGEGTNSSTEGQDMKRQDKGEEQQQEEKHSHDDDHGDKRGERSIILFTPSSVYRIAATAASYLQSQTKIILPITSPKLRVDPNSIWRRNEEEDEEAVPTSSSMASFVATTSSVTAVVAAEEETKRAIAQDLSSSASSPCEWFICDDDTSGTRFFIIQGSESLASWQANLLFEPIPFEGTSVLVHRGIYEAAKGLYQQLLPQVRNHDVARGASATYCFTGHSLGGSLSLLLSLMLVTRRQVQPSSLLPVVMFGSPYVMCGGDLLLQKLGLPLSHVQTVTMHRDIVPRAFSCRYPDYLAEILKTINSKFREHPCLQNKLLYSPMGELLILQPEETYSPRHHLLPPESGLYFLSRDGAPLPLLKSAMDEFLNSPHPLEILSDGNAYGSKGTIFRDHDVHAYVSSISAVLRRETGDETRNNGSARRRRSGTWWRRLRVKKIGSSGLPVSLLVTAFVVVEGGRKSLERLQQMVNAKSVNLVFFLVPLEMSQQLTWIRIFH
ncbi:phospholipase A1 PLIP2, chloroplastic-like isoform X2 [Wolffia australiana]